jgi:hypothetical protein
VTFILLLAMVVSQTLLVFGDPVVTSPRQVWCGLSLSSDALGLIVMNRQGCVLHAKGLQPPSEFPLLMSPSSPGPRAVCQVPPL